MINVELLQMNTYPSKYPDYIDIGDVNGNLENNWNLYAKLCDSCFYNKSDVDILLSECIKRKFSLFNHALYSSCEGNNIYAVSLILNNVQYNLEKDFALYYACKSGNLEIIDILIKQGAKNFDLGLVGAYKGKNKNSIEKMLKLGANKNNPYIENIC